MNKIFNVLFKLVKDVGLTKEHSCYLKIKLPEDTTLKFLICFFFKFYFPLF
ncbi:unnamed protein product [Arabidopsis halleri]